MGTLLPRLPALLGDFITTYKSIYFPQFRMLRGPCQILKKDTENSEIATCILKHPPELSTNSKSHTAQVRLMWRMQPIAVNYWSQTEELLDLLMCLPRQADQGISVSWKFNGTTIRCGWVGCIWYLRAFFIWGCVFWSSMHNGTSIKFGWNVFDIQE